MYFIEQCFLLKLFHIFCLNRWGQVTWFRHGSGNCHSSRCVWSPGAPWSLFSSKSLRFHQSAWFWSWSYLSTWPLVHPWIRVENDLKKTDGFGVVRCSCWDESGFWWFLRMLRPWVLGKGWIEIRSYWKGCRVASISDRYRLRWIWSLYL